MGITEQAARRFGEPNLLRVTLGDLLLLPEESAKTLLGRLLARLRGRADRELTPPPPTRSFQALEHDAMLMTSRLVVELEDMLSNGHTTPEIAKVIVQRSEEAIEAFEQVRAKARAVEKQ